MGKQKKARDAALRGRTLFLPALKERGFRSVYVL